MTQLSTQELKDPSRPCHFAAARQLSRMDTHEGAKILSAISDRNPGRAAILLVDAYSYGDMNVAGELLSRLPQRPFERIGRFIEQMPTIEAGIFRRDVREEKEEHAFAPSYAAWRHLEPGLKSIPESLDYLPLPNSYNLSKISPDIFKKRFLPLTCDPSSDRRIESLYAWAAAEFPPENYGFCNISGSMKTDPETDCLITWGHEPNDHAPGNFHQCANTAFTAKAYLSQFGIAAEVYMIALSSAMQHYIAVAFLPQGNKFLPVVVDASPFGRSYGPENLSDFVPALLRPRIENDNYLIDMAEGKNIPWFCKYISGDEKIIGFAEARGWPILSLHVLSDTARGMKRVNVDIRKGNPAFSFGPYTENSIEMATLDLILEAVKTPTARFVAMLDRLGIEYRK